MKTYFLREGEPQSFGAICGGEAQVFIEPLTAGEALWIIGGGHCSQAIAKLARECGFYVGVVEDRTDQAAPERFPGVNRLVADQAAPAFIAAHVIGTPEGRAGDRQPSRGAGQSDARRRVAPSGCRGTWA